VVNTNIVGSANVARSAMRTFVEQGHGSLVVIGSVVGKIASPYMSTYVTSKWALHGLVRTLQIESRLHPRISVSLISPGGVDTPIYDLAGTYAGRKGNPPPPIARPETVAEAAVAAIDKPQRDRDVGFANRLMVFGFRRLPGVFDLLVTPLMRLLGLARESVPDGPGNVLDPSPELEAVHGRWPHLWG
jgi:short-subunit dehydrogenase